MKIFTYIPIRSGSKRIPDKNILKVGDKPLFHWSVDFAKLISDDNYITVSSDSDEYLDLAKSTGVSIEKRSAKLASDQATTESAMNFFVNNIMNSYSLGLNDYVCLLQATSPLRRKKLGNSLHDLIQKYSPDSIISINRETSFTWSYKGKIEYITPNYDLNNRPRSQDVLKNRKERLIENGSIYCTKVSNFISSKVRASGNVSYIECNKFEGLEIDNYDDFELISTKFKLEKNKKKSEYCGIN